MTVHQFIKPMVRSRRDYVLTHSYPGYSTMIVDLKNVGGEMIFAVNNGIPMSVHPVALYDANGDFVRFPIKGLAVGPATSGGFVYRIPSSTPLTMRSEVEKLVENWVNWYIDTLPRPF